VSVPWSEGITYWYVFSFDTKFSDGKTPLSSDVDVKNSQNSRLVSESGTVRCDWPGKPFGSTAIAKYPIAARQPSRERRGNALLIMPWLVVNPTSNWLLYR
jgi:hypothetical protein